MNDHIKPTKAFWAISIIGLLWNLMGCGAWFMEYNYWSNPEARLSLPENMQGLYDGNPGWVYIIFAIAVITGALGCIGLLMRKSWATTLFIISLPTAIITHAYSLFGTDVIESVGMSSLIMPILVVLIAIFLIYYSKKQTAIGVLT